MNGTKLPKEKLIIRRNLVSENKIQSVDTNIVLRLILDDVPRQRRAAVRLLMNGADYYVDDYVLGEYEHVMARDGYSREEIIFRIRTLLGNPCFLWNEDIFENVFEDYLEHPKLSFNDCYLAEKAKSLAREPLWTFDRKLVAQMGAKVPR